MFKFTCLCSNEPRMYVSFDLTYYRIGYIYIYIYIYDISVDIDVSNVFHQICCNCVASVMDMVHTLSEQFC
jgi:hypothetical protein